MERSLVLLLLRLQFVVIIIALAPVTAPGLTHASPQGT